MHKTSYYKTVILFCTLAVGQWVLGVIIWDTVRNTAWMGLLWLLVFLAILMAGLFALFQIWNPVRKFIDQAVQSEPQLFGESEEHVLSHLFKNQVSAFATERQKLEVKIETLREMMQEMESGLHEFAVPLKYHEEMMDSLAAEKIPNLDSDLAAKMTQISDRHADFSEILHTSSKVLKTSNDGLHHRITRVRNLFSKIDSMHEAIQKIRGITDQTKLIAFNATIEAASSGSGRRFTVVAQDIRQLAESIDSSNESIRLALHDLKDALEETLEHAHEDSKSMGVMMDEMMTTGKKSEALVEITKEFGKSAALLRKSTTSWSESRIRWQNTLIETRNFLRHQNDIMSQISKRLRKKLTE